jgi:hypothetical protein
MSKPTAQPAPHSWPVSKWPAHVWPCDSARGRRFCRTYEKELVKAKALTRMGRDRVVMGEPFLRYMDRQRAKLLDFEVAANRPEHLAKRKEAHAT